MKPAPFSRTDSPFLTGILEAFGRRRRSFKHQNVVLVVDRIVEVTDGNKLERLEISCKPRERQTLQMSVWEDRQIWIQACESIKNAGWKFEFTDSGRLLPSKDLPALVSAFEASFSAMFEMTSESVELLGRIWSPLLAKGPKAV